MPLIETPEGTAFFAPAGRPASAPAVVLIHGAGGSHLDWPAALRRLPGRRTLAIDLPGHGRSPGPARATIPGYSRWLAALLSALEVAPAVLVGHSMGAAVALDLAYHAPERVAGLVLIGFGGRLAVDAALLAGSYDSGKDTAVTFVEVLYGADAPAELVQLARARVAGLPPGVLENDLRAAGEFDARPLLAGIAAPALLVAGGQDRLAPIEDVRRLHAGLRQSRLIEFPDAGHMVVLERTGEVADAVVDFLEWLAGRS